MTRQFPYRLEDALTVSSSSSPPSPPHPSSLRIPGSTLTLPLLLPLKTSSKIKMGPGVRWDDDVGLCNSASAETTHRFRPRATAGFTLVELMVVIVIIGLLATMVMINVMPSQDRAMVEKARADVSVLEQAVETFRLDNLTYPRTEQGLDALVNAPSGLARPERYRRGGYVRRLPDDPWGNAYQYRLPGREGAFDVYSFGADGTEGGEDDNADIGNWR